MPLLYPDRKPLKRRSSSYVESETVTLPGGEVARVQVCKATGHARWNASQFRGIGKAITGAVIDGRFYPLDPSDEELIVNGYKRRRRASLYDGSYHPWK